MKKTTIHLTQWVMFFLFIGYTTYLRILYTSPYARSWDQVDFALAVTNYDLYLMQPHFPGYPYFILGGMLLNYWLNDPVLALSVFNTMMVTTAVIPIFLLLKKHFITPLTLLLAAVIHSMSYMGVMSTEPMSEAAAVTLIWWYVWSIQHAVPKYTLLRALMPLIFFSLLIGVRLSHAPFGIGILLLWNYDWKYFGERTAYFAFIAKQAVIALSLQLVWVAGLIWSTGGMGTFFELASGFVSGHFTEWGGAVTTDSQPFINRFFYLTFFDLFWTGMFAHSWGLAIIYIVLIILVVIQFLNRAIKIEKCDRWVVIMWFCYFLWVLFAQNVDKPRHILPLTGLLLFLLLKYLFNQNQRKLSIIAIFLCFILLISQTLVGRNLISEKARERPAVYQLSEYLSEIDEPLIVYTWEEARVMEYLDATYSYKKIFTYEYFQMNRTYHPHAKIFLTNHVIKGFEAQGHSIQGAVKKVADFHSDAMFDPVYGDIILYEWVGEGKEN
jgi:hypothetical protein